MQFYCTKVENEDEVNIIDVSNGQSNIILTLLLFTMGDSFTEHLAIVWFCHKRWNWYNNKSDLKVFGYNPPSDRFNNDPVNWGIYHTPNRHQLFKRMTARDQTRTSFNLQSNALEIYCTTIEKCNPQHKF